MVSEEEFKRLCDGFYRIYKKAKKNPDQLSRLSEITNKPIESVMSEYKEIDCHSGCSHCCQLRVVAFSHELVSIYYYLVSRVKSVDLVRIKERLINQFLLIKDLTTDEHFTRNIECPMLINGRCSVYPVRPISCAGYHSRSEESCIHSNENPHIVGNDGGGIPQVAPVNFSMSLQNTIVIQVAEAIGEDSEKYELIRGLHSLFQNPKLVQQWKKGRRLFKTL
jgi:Fe-S-cluster containining protein